MDKKLCNKCPYKESFYIGTNSQPVFTDSCFWTLKRIEDVKYEECRIVQLGSKLLRKLEEKVNG